MRNGPVRTATSIKQYWQVHCDGSHAYCWTLAGCDGWGCVHASLEVPTRRRGYRWLRSTSAERAAWNTLRRRFRTRVGETGQR